MARDGAVWEQKYERGKPVRHKLKQSRKRNAQDQEQKVTFHPDPEIFHADGFGYDILAGRLRNIAFLLE